MKHSSDVTLRTYFQSVLHLLLIVVITNDHVDGTCLELCHCLPLLKSWRITCAGKLIKTIPEGLNETVHTLNLFNNSIQFVSFQYHHYPELRVLNLSKNKISRIHHLRSLGNLQELNLSENSIQSFGAVHELPKLKILNLSRNPFKLLDTLRNEGLTHLIADECEISFINPTSLQDLPNLLRLSLKKNPIKLVKSPSSVHLKSLDLSHCEVMFLDGNTFVDLPNLEELILKNNSQLGQYQYNGLTLMHKKLQILDISQCNINQCSFIELPELKTAILSNNKVSSINDDIFKNNKKLEIVLMNKNRIKYVDTNSFNSLKNLRDLDLSYNLIASINGTTFSSNYRLDILNLSFNALEDVAGLNAPYVRILDLSNNDMRYFDRNQFVRLSRLQHLNLSNNILEDFPRLFGSMNLETLDLKRNRISNISDVQILNLIQLNKLILAENEFEELQAETFNSNLNLTVLDLSRNPWDCECNKLRSLYFYLSTIDNSSLDKTMCFNPMEKRGYTWQSACIFEWIEPPRTTRPPKTLSFIIVTLLLFIVVSGSIVSVRHTIKMRRIERNRQIEAERTEIRERLRRLQRRNQQLEEEAINHLSDQIINPLELAGPPSYEEAVDMARLTRSLDTLNSLGTENTPVTQALGSVDNLRSKRRARRPKKKTLSDDSLTKRESRREIRLKRDRELRQNLSHVIDVEGANQSLVTENRDRYSVTFNVSHSSSEHIDSTSDMNRQRPPTPITKKKKRSRHPTVDVTTTDDEASDEDRKDKESSNVVAIMNLRSEPRRRDIDD